MPLRGENRLYYYYFPEMMMILSAMMTMRIDDYGDSCYYYSLHPHQGHCDCVHVVSSLLLYQIQLHHR
jgi:hypothetical protein